MRHMTMGITIAILAAWAPEIVNAGPTTGAAVPLGSYLQTCSQATFDRTTKILSASCAATAPNHDFLTGVAEALGAGPQFQAATTATLGVSHCNPGADIANINGSLQCLALAGTWGQGGAVPNGSYQRSCDQWFVKNRFLNGKNGATYSTLVARCATFSNNGTVTAELDLSQCSMTGDIQNHQGQLLCDPAPNQPATAQAAAPPPAPGTCKSGFVWRMADNQDHVCVTPQTRQQVANDNAAASQHQVARPYNVVGRGPPPCLKGFVWRMADATDYVCVTPQTRSQAASDNAAAKSRTVQ